MDAEIEYYMFYMSSRDFLIRLFRYENGINKYTAHLQVYTEIFIQKDQEYIMLYTHNVPYLETGDNYRFNNFALN